MLVDETFYRPDEVGRESRRLTGAIYNLARVLLRRSGTGSLFVPIRAMQYLAVLDEEEFIFVDREHGRMIELAWREFRPGAREALGDPVPYEAVYYTPKASAIMTRLHAELARALQELERRALPVAGARILKLSVPT
jgi:hypothetical protein